MAPQDVPLSAREQALLLACLRAMVQGGPSEMVVDYLQVANEIGARPTAVHQAACRLGKKAGIKIRGIGRKQKRRPKGQVEVEAEEEEETPEDDADVEEAPPSSTKKPGPGKKEDDDDEMGGAAAPAAAAPAAATVAAAA